MKHTLTLLCNIGIACAFALTQLNAAAQLTITPTTTLSAETANNTSANANFKAQTNGNTGPGNVSKTSIRTLLYPGSTTKIYGAVMPWFGRADHMSVGYTSSDPAQITAQIKDMQSRGIQGAIIPWYGRDSYINSDTAITFMQAAQTSESFEFSIMIDVGALVTYAQQNGCDVTTQLITDLNYIASTFYGSAAYTKVGGRPVVYFFGVEAYYIDWNRVRLNIAGNPMLTMRNSGASSDPNADGAYSWVEIDASDPGDMMLSYLDGFYTTAQSSSKYTVGSGSKAFNDTLAAWGSNRILNQQCGLTWLDTFAETNKYYSSSHQLAAVQVVTWNDYEEGTEIESGIDNCVALAPTLTASTLTWSVGQTASESTIVSYSVFISTDGQNLMKLVDVPAGTHALNLSQYNLAPRNYVLYVKAIGKASILNHMSPAVAFNPSNQAPTASLSLSSTSGPAPFNISASSAGSSDRDGSITAVKFDFGDGTVVSGGAGFATSHIYKASGTFTVTLTVGDNTGLFSSTQQTVTVAAGPGVTITSPSPGTMLNSPVHVAATAYIVGGVSYMEVLIDGATPSAYITTGAAVDTFLQITAGQHTLRVVAHDTTAAANYIYSDATITVGANDAPPYAVLTVNPFGAGYTVMACTATSTDPDGFIIGSLVDFGDGATAFGPTAFHTYASAGTYKVTAIVTDNDGLTSATSVSVTVKSAGTLAGFVTSVTDGFVLAGAKVTLGGTSIYSGSNGYYSFSNLSAGTYVLTASASGFLARSYNVNVTAGATATQNIQLSTAGVLQGTVTNGSRVGVAGAAVSITGGVLASSFSVSTSSNGSYNFGWIPVGTYVVQVAASGFPSATMNTTINTGQTTTLAIPLFTATGRLAGYVRNITSGLVLAGAKVSVGSTSIATDSKGYYSFTAVPGGSFVLSASASGFLARSYNVNITAGTTVTQDIQLSTAGVLQGTIANNSHVGL